MEKLSFTVEKSGKISRLVARSLPYAALMKSFRNKDVKVNGRRVSSDVEVNIGDSVEIYYVPHEKPMFSEVYSDGNVFVVDKASGHTSEELFASVCEKYPTARFIHRLDRNTTGVMIFALNDSAERELLAGFKARTFEKIYRARVKGVPAPREALLSAYLIKDEKAAEVKISARPTKGSVAIKTGYKVLSQEGETSVLEVRLYTGKTHQIRAHLAYIGHPVVGDGKYGDSAFNRRYGAKSQSLNAYSLKLIFANDSPLSYLNGKTFISER